MWANASKYILAFGRKHVFNPAALGVALTGLLHFDGLVDSADGLTADQVANQVGVSRVTAWRYLERLADDGTVSRRTDYGKAGRPKTRYQWN